MPFFRSLVVATMTPVRAFSAIHQPIALEVFIQRGWSSIFEDYSQSLPDDL